MSLPCSSSFSWSGVTDVVSSVSGTGVLAQSGKNSTVSDVLIASVAGMQHLQFLWCSGALLMKKPLVPRSSHDPQSIGLSCADIFVPAIDMWCLMKSRCPCGMVCTEMFLFILDGLSEFKVNSVCGSERSH